MDREKIIDAMFNYSYKDEVNGGETLHDSSFDAVADELCNQWISTADEDWQHDYRKANLVYIEYVDSGSDEPFAKWVYDKMVEKDNSLPSTPVQMHPEDK